MKRSCSCPLPAACSSHSVIDPQRLLRTYEVENENWARKRKPGNLKKEHAFRKTTNLFWCRANKTWHYVSYKPQAHVNIFRGRIKCNGRTQQRGALPLRAACFCVLRREVWCWHRCTTPPSLAPWGSARGLFLVH